MSSTSDYGPKVDPIAVIQDIIHGYPFGVGIFREILQNSEDARASKQIFLLDTRHHLADSLYHSQLKNTQGPALIAYNNAAFQEADWEALQTVHQSSKKMDTSQITDNPQVLSSSLFGIFDLQNQFTKQGGVRIDVSDIPKDHLHSLNFEWFKPLSSGSESFPGTIIRLPLRASNSKIKKELVTHEDIYRLIEVFIQEELDIVLLFLSSLRSIEIYVINEGDQVPRLIASTAASQDRGHVMERFQTSVRHIVTTLSGGDTRDQKWRVLHAFFDGSECASLLSERLGSNAKETMEEEKLTPNIALAVSFSPPAASNSEDGRLFTYLPLPLFTEFPCHIHGLFALDKSRQYLRNASEKVLDKTPDRTRVEWNLFLFDTLIPRAWSQLITTFIDQDGPSVENIFRIWPSQRSDLSEWRCVPVRLLEEIISTNKTVWPVIPYSSEGGTNEYFALGDVLVSSEADIATLGQLLALAKAGLRITQLPQHVYKLTVEHVKARRLTPDTAREALLEHTDQLADRDLILSYLLSSGRLETIINLPLIPLVGGTIASLSKYSVNCSAHVLLDADAQLVFSSLDPSAISLSQLPLLAKTLLLETGEGFVNTKVLSCDIVVSYLNLAFQKFGISSTTIHDLLVSPEAIKWFLIFWVWVPFWTSAKELYPSLKSLALLPTTKNGLQSPQNGIFLPDTLDPQLSQSLETVGVPFLHRDYSAHHATCDYLREQGSIKYVSRVCDLLFHIRPTSLGYLEAEHLRKHILAPNTNFEGVDRVKLRNWPIFNRLVPCSTQSYTITSSLEPITDKLELKCVLEDSILPVVPGVFYISDLQLARVVSPHIQQLSEVDVLRLAVENFPAQPPELQVAFLMRMHDIRNEIPQNFLQELRACVFVHAEGGALRPPAEIFDPMSEVAKLILEGDVRLPRRSTQVDIDIVDALRMLGLLRDTFTIDMARERIQFVAANTQGIALSEKLLDEMERQAVEYSALGDIINLPWLPTNYGLCSPSKCRDNADEPLCRDVLPLLTRNREIRSPELRKAFGWNMPIPLSFVVQQFRHILTDTKSPPSASQFHDLILHFGSRVGELDEGVICDLTGCTNDRKWIPTSGCPQELSPTAFSVFYLDGPLPVFRRIIPSLEDDRGTKEFLERMGCTQRPSNDALLQAVTLCKHSVKQVVGILKAIHFETLSEGQRALNFVPDSDGTLRAPSDLCYNDLGINVSQSSNPGEFFFAHEDIKYEIAIQLKLILLSSSKIPLDDEYEDMQEDLTRRISGVLRQYTKEQAFLEFLANAADAKATEFGIYLDEFVQEEKHHLLTPAMSQFQQEPSLIIYNNGEFSSKDWRGIQQVGMGGKRMENEEYQVDSSDVTIGRFGLGALSMFHFTEVAMIVSGDRVMFLDPTKQHIDGAKTRSCKKIPLVTMNKHFPGHLAPLEGIFGFSTSTNYYPGTIFRLSLRTEHQARRDNNPILNEWQSPDGIRSLLSDFYKRFAPSALLFIKIQKMYAIHRSGRGHESDIWTVAATQRKPMVSQNATPIQLEEIVIRHSECGKMHVEDKWQLLVERIPCDSIPKKHREVMLGSHIRSVMIGIAGLLTDEHPDRERCRIFFGVPVPTYTSLPVHLHGSFIFSDDRRNIRFEDDGDGNPESLYNKWLLSEMVPLVYLNFLESLPAGRKLQETNWWPKSSPEDVISRFIIGAVIRFFSTSERLLCDSFAGPRLAPRTCVFLSGIPPSDARGVRNVLQLLRPPDLAKLPPLAISPDALNQADSRYLAHILRNHEHEFQIRISDVVDVVRFLSSKSGENHISIGLPLVPLVSGDLASFARAGDFPTIYTWNPLLKPLPWLLFGSEYFLHPDVDPTLMIGQGLNVSELTGDAVIKFIGSRFQHAGQFYMQDEDQKWIGNVCSVLEHLEVIKEDIFRFPLVPVYLSQTANTRTYISIETCNSDNTIPLGTEFNLPRLHSIQRLGAFFVKWGDCPPKLQKFLLDFQYSFESVLKFFATIPKDQIPTCFSRVEVQGESWSFAEWRSLAEWIRGELKFIPNHTRFSAWSAGYQNSLHLRSIARRLPVWEVIRAERGNFVDGIAAAEQILMLPQPVELSIAQPFLPRPNNSKCAYAAFSETLSNLEVSTLDMAAFRDSLVFPPVMTTISNAYMTLLEVIVHNCPANHPIQVPNANGRMKSSNELYSRSEPLFRDAFSTRRGQQKLLHPLLEHLETQSQLFKFGLRHELNFESFLAAAEAIDKDVDDDDKVRRATQVYGVYNHRLYQCILGEASYWNRLDALHFIPRDVIRRSTLGTTPFDQFARPLPQVISPAQSLAPKYRSVAWTQRALFRDEPSEQLLLSNPSLGQPSIGDVIEHLRVLSQDIAPHHKFDSNLISDLEATYSWLNERVRDARTELLEYSQDTLFLNVDDPKTGWEWEPAQNLVFDAPDEANRRGVRVFISKFKDLLLSAGAHEIKRVTVPTNVKFTPIEEAFATIRKSFDEMRKNGKLTDVIFDTQDGKEFHAHRVILAAQSEYFRDMFTGSFIESGSISIPILKYPDYAPASVEIALEYMYTGNIPENLSFESLVDTFRLSDYFSLRDLNTKVQMKLIISNFITPGSYEDLLTLSGDYPDGPLAEACRDYEAKNLATLGALGL